MQQILLQYLVLFEVDAISRKLNREDATDHSRWGSW